MSRQKQLEDLEIYMKKVDKDITIIFQNLQWDRNKIIKKPAMSTCKYDANHKVPVKKLDEHESKCFLKCHGYTDEDSLLPELLNINSDTVVKFSTNDVQQIINRTAENDPFFKKGANSDGAVPLTVERLQAAYSADERRALYDAVLAAVHSTQQTADFVMPSGSGGDRPPEESRSRLEELAARRDRHRRRTKYRAPPKTRNYSDVLRNVISTQMEVFTEAQASVANEKHSNYTNNVTEQSVEKNEKIDRADTNGKDRHRSRYSDQKRYHVKEYKETAGRHDRHKSDCRYEGRNRKYTEIESETRKKLKKEKERNSVESTGSKDTNRYQHKYEKSSYSDKYTSSSNDIKHHSEDNYIVHKHRSHRSRDGSYKRQESHRHRDDRRH